MIIYTFVKISELYKQTHTSESTRKVICMPLSNKGVGYCHTNSFSCSLNGAFIVYIILISYGRLLAYKILVLLLIGCGGIFKNIDY